MIVYMSIGNSDDKLTQKEWNQFYIRMQLDVASLASTIHGIWFSNPADPYQNVCWGLEFDSESIAEKAMHKATEIRKVFRQDSVAWATAVTDFI